MTPTTQTKSRGARIALVTAGLVSAVLAFGLVVGGGAMLWAHSEKDAQGFVSTDDHEFRTQGAALVTENMDVDLDGADWLVDGEDFGDVQVRVEPAGDERMFVGIARTADVEAYLAGVAHSTITDVHDRPFEADLRDAPGARRAPRPGRESFWAARSAGAGVQTLDWHVEDGDWSIVVMNADGTPGVAADVAVGAKVPWLDEAGGVALGGGVALYAVAFVLLLAGFRSTRRVPRGTGHTGAAPAAA